MYLIRGFQSCIYMYMFMHVLYVNVHYNHADVYTCIIYTCTCTLYTHGTMYIVCAHIVQIIIALKMPHP